MATSQTTITEEQEATIQNIVAIHAHEGITLSEETVELSKMVITGEISGDDAVARILSE